MVFLVQETRTGLFKKCVWGGGLWHQAKRENGSVCVWGGYLMKNEEKRSCIVIST